VVHHTVIYTTLLLFNTFLLTSDVKVSFVLGSIDTLSELDHFMLWPTSISPLFNRPFLPPTLGHFWNRGWHFIILSLVSSLVFDPASKLGGRPACVRYGMVGLSSRWENVL
jgi:hypothetical protein